MTDFTQDFLTSRRNFTDGNIRIGEEGRLWYDSITNTIRISDGISQGGIIVSGSGSGTVQRVNTGGSGLGFSLGGGPITTIGTVTLNVPTPAELRANLNIGTVANVNLNSNANTVLNGEGNWISVGSGSVTEVNSAGSGLGFSLGGGPITSTGTITLTVPSVLDLRNALNIGTVANVNLSGNSNTVLNGEGNWIAAGSGSVTEVNSAGSGLGFSLSGGPITSTGTITLNIPSSNDLRANLNIGTVANVNLSGNANTVLNGEGNWIIAGSGSGTVTEVNTDGSGLGFSLSGGPITSTGNITLNIPSATDLRANLNIGTVANVNLSGNSNTVLNGEGNWIVAGTGTVTEVNTDGSGLGFSLSGGPITSTGNITLNIPSAEDLKANLNIGNISSINLNGNSNTVLAGDGNWVMQSSSYILPIASANILGGIKVGTGLTINPDGTLNVSATGLNAWQTFVVSGQGNLTASGDDTLEIVAGNGIYITTAPTAMPNPQLVINASVSTNLDGGFPGSIYGGVPFIDAGGV